MSSIFQPFRWCLVVLVVGLPVITFAQSAETPERITDGVLVLYTFQEPGGDLVKDRSEVNPPLDLRIEKSQSVSRRHGLFTVHSAARIVSQQPAKKIIAAVKSSGELTIEAWLKPLDDKQAGPARIVSLSQDPGLRNFTLGQDAKRYDVRCRTTATSTNGIPSLPTSDGTVTTGLTHVVYTREKSGLTRIYINGKQQAEAKIEGDFSNWSDDYRLSLANELTGDRPWLGELHLVALFGRALPAAEVEQNFRAGVKPAIDYAKLLPPAVQREVSFVGDVQPILRKHCFECHSAGNEEGNLNLGVRARVMEGGSGGPVLSKGDSAASRLVHVVAGLEAGLVMPPEGDRLTPDEIGILRAWIDQGANWPSSADVLDPRMERARQHWAFQPLHEVPLPPVRQSEWIRTPIDQFILARLESAGLQPAPRLAPRGLIRRAAFDLTGLPPDPADIDKFVEESQADAAQAWANLIDRLLASERYGERWGRHWLDVARYADSDGQESDRDRPLAYHYRDFVIRALNDDMPFDQFVRWQLAGDEYEPENPQAVAATGFLAAGPFAALPERLMEDERLRNRYNELDDMVSTIGTGLLGLTLGCARCHDHKYDAIPARDYYRLMSALHSGDRAEIPLGNTTDKTLGYRDFSADPRPSWLFRRGDYYDHELPVQLGFVSLFVKDKTPEEYWQQARAQSPLKTSTQQRRAVAEWITDPQNGAGALVARVIVNRLWQHHFGQGLVRTVGDFGVRSEPPTHPELLEWLAQDLVQNGWKLKRLQRLILLSAVYQQASTGPAPPEADPDNRLLWKFPLQRLEAEVLRDSLLAVSGTLNLTAYGPAVKPPIAAEAMLARNLKDPYPGKIEDGPAVRRRSVYLFHKRVVPLPLLQAFDKPDAQQSCGRRDNTTVAPQALALLNDQFVRTLALDFADRLLKEAGDEPTQWIERSYRLALGRAPHEREREIALAFLEQQQQARKERAAETPPEELRRRALADYCQILFGLNEFLYID